MPSGFHTAACAAVAALCIAATPAFASESEASDGTTEVTVWSDAQKDEAAPPAHPQTSDGSGGIAAGAAGSAGIAAAAACAALRKMKGGARP